MSKQNFLTISTKAICLPTHTWFAFGIGLKNQFSLLFSLFLVLFMGPIVLFGTIHGSHYTISVTF